MRFGCMNSGNSRVSGGCYNKRLRQLGGTVLFVVLASLATNTAVVLANPQETNPSANVPKLEGILAGMDRAASRFTSMMADLEYTKVTVIVNDHSTERGQVFFEKSAGKTRVMVAFHDPAEKYALFADGKVDLYQPKIAEVDEYQLSQNKDLVEQFLLLGFGTSGTELKKAYRISLRGQETVDGQPASVLELVPNSPKVAAQLQSIELWISPKTWQPLQQKFHEPGGDYVTALYSNLKWNEKIPDKNFRLPIKGKVRTVKPQAP